MLSWPPFGSTTMGSPSIDLLISPMVRQTSPSIWKWSFRGDDFDEIAFAKLLLCAVQYIFQIIGIMLLQNSSKPFPKILNSLRQEVNSIEVQICGQAKSLGSDDFFELRQLVNVINMPEIKNLDLHALVYCEKNISVLHIFLYYCIKVNLELDIEGVEELYLKQLGSFYVSTGFNIQIAKYAIFCSLATLIDVKKCAHMIYYLVYGRLATSSYINHIVQLTSKADKKKQRLRTVLSTKYINKKDSSFRSQRIAETSQNEQSNNYKQLAQDLKDIFNNISKHQEHCLTGKQHEECREISPKLEKSTEIKNKYYISFFPNRVFNQEKSAIFQRVIPASKSHYKLMRKKKFDESRLDKMLYASFNDPATDQTKNESMKYQPIQKKHRSKIFTQNVMKTNEKFKNICSNLDKIRGALTKSKRQTHNWQLSTVEGDRNMENCEKSYIQFKQKLQNNKKLDVLLACDLQKTQYESENKFSNLLRKQQRGARGKKDSQYSMRSKENKKFNLGFESLSKRESNKIVHSDCKNRLSQYKNEFRRFIKVHLFRSDDQK